MSKREVSRRDFLKGAVGAMGIAAIHALPIHAAEEAAVYTPGTYTAAAKGMNGDVTVTMTFDAVSITDVVIDASGETESIGGAAADKLVQQIMEGQGADIDGVTGATVTGNAVKKAAAQCIAQAKGVDVSAILETAAPAETGEEAAADWLGEEPEIADSDIVETLTTDLLIVGAGNGGMMAACQAADLKMDFIVAEKHSTVCDTRHWFGAVNSHNAAEAGVEVNKFQMLSEISRYASGKCDQRVVKVWINESAACQDYVEQIMAKYGHVCDFESDTGEEPGVEDAYDYCAPIQHFYRAGEDAPEEYQSLGRNQLFEKYINEQGYQVTFNRSLVKLVKEGDRVAGGIFQNTEDNTYVKILANKGVLLATGGYAANTDMMEQLSPTAAAVTSLSYYWPYNTGDGIKAGVWAGAARDPEAAPMLFDRGLVAPGVDSGYTTDEFGNKTFPGTGKQWNPTTQPFLKVNRDGVRVMNESVPYNDGPYTAYSQKGRVLCQIFDSNFPEDVTRFHTLGCSAQTRQQLPRFWGETGAEGEIEQKVQEGLIMKADTIEELADKLGFEGESKQNFIATVARYNVMYEMGKDEDFGKEFYRMSSITKAPFYGSWYGASLLTTCDGLRINEKMQVMGTDYNPIEGLYATGDCSGSFFADNYPELLPGVACGRTLTFALKAVRQINGTDE